MTYITEDKTLLTLLIHVVLVALYNPYISFLYEFFELCYLYTKI